MKELIKERFPLVRPLFVPLILYIGLVAFANTFLASNPGSSWRYPVALFPILPGLFLAFGITGAIRKLDELGRKVILESLAIAFALTFLLTLSLGFLGLAG